MRFPTALLVLTLIATAPCQVAVSLAEEPAGGSSASAPAAPRPGETITAKDADRVKDLVSPGVHWLVTRGMNMKIIAHEFAPDPPAYREATEKYSPQVKLRPDGVLDESTYVAGRPFPIIDINDPQAAIKIMYNFERTRYFTDDLAATYFDAETGSIEGDGSQQTYDIERHFVLAALRIFKYVGRTEQPPIPAMPNPGNFFAKAGQYPVIEPFDLKGVGGVGWRYLDPSKHDDVYIYLPSLRRVRRLSSAQRSDALFGQDIDVDSYGGYAGQIPWFSWKLLGVKSMLGSGHGENLPPVPCKDDGGVTFCENWEQLPKVYVIEGVSKLAGYAYSKRIIFVDAETNFISYTDLYDQGGQLWKVAINHGRYSKRPNPRVAFEYPFARDFLYGFVMVDIQLEHGTRAALPGMGFPNEPGWYINQGEKTGIGEDWFTVAALIKAGR